jgi:hypothetical protein
MYRNPIILLHVSRKYAEDYVSQRGKEMGWICSFSHLARFISYAVFTPLFSTSVTLNAVITVGRWFRFCWTNIGSYGGKVFFCLLPIFATVFPPSNNLSRFFSSKEFSRGDPDKISRLYALLPPPLLTTVCGRERWRWDVCLRCWRMGWGENAQTQRHSLVSAVLVRTLPSVSMQLAPLSPLAPFRTLFGWR